MAQGSVHVEGLREWNRYLGLIDKKLQREFQKRLRTEVAEPVARRHVSKRDLVTAGRKGCHPHSSRYDQVNILVGSVAGDNALLSVKTAPSA